MRLLISVLLILGFSQFSMATCPDGHDSADKAKSAKTAYNQQIKVTGMSCNSCVKNVKGELADIKLSKGVKLLVEVNLITIDYSENKEIDKTEINKIVEQAKAALAKTKYKVVEG